MIAVVDVLTRAKDRPVSVEATLVTTFQALFDAKYTGRIYLDFAQGQPKALQIPTAIGAIVKLI